MKRFLYLQSPNSLPSLTDACLSLTPKVSVCALKPRVLETSEEQNGLFLEISATEKFFGGEPKILSRAEEIFEHLRWQGKAVLTDRPEWGVALATDSRCFSQPGQSRRLVEGLPIRRLSYCGDPWRISDEIEERLDLTGFLRKVGMRFIADFLHLPLPSVQKRFGKMGSLLHDWAGGKRDLVLPLFFPKEPIRENVLADDIGGMDALLHLLKQVLTRVEVRLKGRGLSATKVELQFALESRHVVRTQLSLKEPLQQSAMLWDLLRDHLRNSTLTWNSPLQDLEVGILETVPESKGQLSLFEDAEKRFGDLADFMTRLQSRLGEGEVGVAECLPHYLPERSFQWVWPQATKPKELPVKHCPKSRPYFLYDPPIPFSPSPAWKLAPVEKLSEKWWETEKACDQLERTYFLAEGPKGERLWVFWSKNEDKWFVQGAYD